MSVVSSTIPELLRENAARYGQKVAFSSPGRIVTHHDLLIRTSRIACSLNKAEVARGHCVAVLLDRCVEAVESIFAIIRAGAIAVLLDPRSSEAELATMLADVSDDTRCIITDSSGAQRIRKMDGIQSTTIWTIDAAHSTFDTLPFEDLADAYDTGSPDDLASDDKAFMFYTSGSTGSKPKGVISSQQSWIRSTQASMTTSTGVRSDDKILCPLPITHAYGFSSGVMVVLCTGASMHMTGQESLREALAGDSYTVFIGVPTHYSEMVNLDNTTSCLSSVRLCVSGGAAASLSLNRQVEDTIGVSILNHYGCTETCGIVTVCLAGSPYQDGSCGQLVPGREVRIVEPTNQQDVSVLLIEYHNEYTTPFTDGWYRSGDLGRWDDQGNLFITGRLKETIVRGGENIHPLEIEQVLSGCPGVKECVVVAAPHNIFGEVPVAYVVPDRQTPLSMAALVSACRMTLPSHKIPTDFFGIDAIPPTRSGKPRRRAVVSCAKKRLVTESYTATAIEDIILAEFTHARGITSGTLIDPTIHFSDMGMNSLIGIVIRDRLVSMTGLELPITLLFDHPTPRSLANHVHDKLSGKQPNAQSTTALSTPISTPPSTPRFPGNDEPIAIVSMSCRYPGGIASPEDLWNVVEAGVDVTSDFPPDRGWDLDELYSSDPDVPGTTSTRRGGFLHNMADFNAGLFGMSPREAQTTDPQQRLLLESTWVLLERAGIPPLSLRGSDTGVHVGVMYNDYASRFTNEKHEHEGQLGLGSAPSVAAGRISHFFDLLGPSLAVDTACSSSLVAIDQAAKSLRLGECSLAIAGGVTVMATPQAFVMFSKQRGLSPDGRCRSYSDEANGTAWSEGVGLLLLERLSDARRNGHRVLGLIRGVATNSDGRSNTLTSPSGPPQERVIQAALRNSGLSPDDIDVIEGHGTATPLGDPIEIRALMATYGQSRSEPALLGSLKSNLGHTQAAAGVAGIIKMIIAMQKGMVPATLHVSKPSRHVDWSSSNIELVIKARPWPQRSSPRKAAISAFGIGGTNAHVIIEQGDIETSISEDCPRSQVAQLSPWFLSGTDKSVLQAQARQAQGLQHLHPSDVAYSLATTRSLLRWRAAIPPGNVEALEALAQGMNHPRALVGPATAPRLVIMFSGQGGQFAEMFRELSAAFPIFEAKLRTVCEAINIHREEPLLETLLRSRGLVDRIDVSQLAIFAFQVALYRTLEHFGVVPTYLIGHSIGEITAAHVSGILSLEHAAEIVAERGRLMNTVEPGAMASIESSKEEVESFLDEVKRSTNDAPDIATIAAINSETSVVVSGTREAVAFVQNEFRGRGHRTKTLRVSHACHSPAMFPIQTRLLDALERVQYKSAETPIVSTVTGRAARDSDLGDSDFRSPLYWMIQLLAPVRFSAAINAVRDLGGSLFLEIGPTAALSTHVQDAVPTGATMKSLIEALTSLTVCGCDVNWSRVLEGSGARRVELPTYPFQRRRYWLDPPKKAASREASRGFLGTGVVVPGSKQISFSGRVSLKTQPWLRDHVMSGKTILPATAFVEMALIAGRELGLNVLEELTLLTPLDLSLDDEVRLQMILEEARSNSARTFSVFSRPAEAEILRDWTLHASGSLKAGPSTRGGQLRNSTWPCAGEIDITGAYDRLSANGILYGPAFRCVQRFWQGKEHFTARLVLADCLEARDDFVHPALLDAALHMSMLATTSSDSLRLPFRLIGVRVWASEERELRAVVRILETGDLTVKVYSLRGQLVAEIEKVSLRALKANSGNLFSLQWSSITIESPLMSKQEPQPHVIRVRAQGSEVEAVHKAVNYVHSQIKHWKKVSCSHSGKVIVVITERAMTSDPDLGCAAAWGFVRSAQSETGDTFTLIDVDGTAEAEDCVENAILSGETVLAIRGARIMSPRLVKRLETQEKQPMNLDGSVLITGGTGALGIVLCRHLIQKQGAKHLLLTSRSGTAPDNMAELTAHGASITVQTCDVAAHTQLKALIDTTTPAITAVFHAAGVLDDGTLDSLTAASITKVLKPKVDGAWNLHNLLPNAQPFVLFSSAAGALGNPGQANYAAANTYLDALARHRVQRGLHAISMAWGPWKNKAGMAGRITEHGPLLPMSDELGMDLLDKALVSAEAVVVPMVVRNEVPQLSRRISDPPESHKLTSVVSHITAATLAEGFAEFEASIRNEVANVLGYEKLPDLPFSEIGLDSLSGVLIRNKITKLTGVSLPSSVMFEVEDVEALAKLVFERLGSSKSAGDTTLLQIEENKTGVTNAGGNLEEFGGLKLTALFRKLCLAGHYAEALGMLAIASLTLPKSSISDIEPHKIALRSLKTSKYAQATVICLPDFLPPTDTTSIFDTLTNYLDADYNVYDLIYPKSSLPDTIDTLTALLVQTMKAAISDQKIILLGFSAGGLLAHSVARALKPIPAGIVLLDTYTITRDIPNWLAALPAREILQAGELFDDGDLAVTGHYLRITQGYVVGDIETPTLFVKAGLPSPTMESKDWEARWPDEHEEVLVDGDHVGLLRSCAERTAAEIDDWIGKLPK